MIFTLVFCVTLFGLAAMADSQNRTGTQLGTSFLKPTLSFEANIGQAEAHVHYLTRGPSYGVQLTQTEAVLVLHRPLALPPPTLKEVGLHPAPNAHEYATLRFRFVGKDVHYFDPHGLGQLEGKSHYFIGNDPAQWHTNVPHYSQVLYPDIYPGIDLLYYGRQGQLEYDLIVAPGANPEQILLEIQGAQRLTVQPDGSLHIATPHGTLLHHRPVIYQELDNGRHLIEGAYHVHHPHHVSFDIGTYDPTRPLYIDPVLIYGSYIQSKGLHGLAIDENNAIYLTGAALPLYSADINALEQDPQGYLDLFVSKFNATGTQLLWSAYLGGAWDDQGRDLAVDKNGNVYVVGVSSSLNFPIVNPLQFDSAIKPENSGLANSGSYDLVVIKLNAQGSALKYASYLGGCGEDGLFGNLAIALGEEQEEDVAPDTPKKITVYLTGATNSPDFPLVDPFQPTYGRTLDTFVTKINSTGTALVYSTFLGGTDSDIAGDIAVDEDGHAHIVGTTFSVNFPTRNAVQDEIGQSEVLATPTPSDIFVTKFQSDGLDVVYSTYLGGNREDEGYGLALNRFGEVFITGSSRSDFFPGAEARPPGFRRGDADVIVSQFSASPGILLNSVRVGGSADDTGFAIALEDERQAWVTGRTASGDFPVTVGAPQPFIGKLITGDDPDVPLGDQVVSTIDAFVFTLTRRSETPTFSTYLGGNGQDEGRAIGVRFLEIPPGPAELTSTLVVGRTFSTDFPRTAAHHLLPSGGFLVDFLESDVPEDQDDRFPCPPFCFPIALPNPPFLTQSFPPITADLTITIQDTPDPVGIGEPLTYTITVTNNGPHPARNVIVTDVLPPEFRLATSSPIANTCLRDLQNQAIVCFLGTLDVNAQSTIILSGIPLASSFHVRNTDTGEDDLIKMPNHASVFNDLPDFNYSNNSAAVFTEIIDPNAQTLTSPLADLSVIKNDLFLRFNFEKNEVEIVAPEDPDPITTATVGRPFLYKITVANAEEVAITVIERDENGDPIHDDNNQPIQRVEVVPTSAAADVILTDLLPPNLTVGFVDIDPPQGVCLGIPDFRCFLGSLDPGAEVTLTVWVIPSSPDEIVNGVLVTTSTTEPPERTPNTDTEGTVIQIPQAIEAADLQVTFTDEEELVLTEEDERDEDEDPPDPIDPDQHTGRGEVTWKLEVLNAGPDKALNVLVTSRINPMKISGLPPTTITHFDSIPPSPLEVRASATGTDTGIRHFQPLKGEVITEDNIDTKCENGKTTEGEECEVDGRFECTLCKEYSPYCVLCRGDDCANISQAFRTENERDDNREPTGKILVSFFHVEPEDIIPQTVLTQLEESDDDELVLSCNIGTLHSEEKFLLDFSLDLTQGIHPSTAEATSLTFDPDPSSNESPAVTTVAVPAGHPTRGGVGGDQGSGEHCFIATAAYGSALAPEVERLRQFRDRFLLPSPAGRLIVEAYYAISPPVAAFIREHPPFKGFMRGALWPIVWWVQLTLQAPYWGVAILMLAVLLTVSALYGMLQLLTPAPVQTPNRKDRV